MIDTENLKRAIKKSGLTQAEVARIIGISPASLSAKINNQTEFKLNEVESLCSFLKIGNKSRIFFAK